MPRHRVSSTHFSPSCPPVPVAAPTLALLDPLLRGYACRPAAWEALINEISDAAYVAMDTEFSGIGDDKDTRAKDVEARYRALKGSPLPTHDLASQADSHRCYLPFALLSEGEALHVCSCVWLFAAGVQKHALLELGLSLWRELPPPAGSSSGDGGGGTSASSTHHQPSEIPPFAADIGWYSVTSYSILLMPAEEFTCTPSSLVFLAEHGTDLTRLCRTGCVGAQYHYHLPPAFTLATVAYP